MAWVSVATAAFRYIKGNPTTFRSSAHATRAFCRVCGTQLTFSNDAGAGEIDVTTCSLDVCSGVEPESHTFTSSQVPWLKLNDGLPCCQRSRCED